MNTSFNKIETLYHLTLETITPNNALLQVDDQSHLIIVIALH